MKNHNSPELSHSESQADFFSNWFKLDDWQFLCSRPGFVEAIDAGNVDLIRLFALEWIECPALQGDPNFQTARRENRIADALLIGRDAFAAMHARAQDAAVKALIERDERHALVTEFVGHWAVATGRTGGKNKQSRQGHIRKLMKHGLDSEYARKMMAECGWLKN